MNPGFRSASQIMKALTDTERAHVKKLLGTKSCQANELSQALLHPGTVEATLKKVSPEARGALKTWILRGGAWGEKPPDASTRRGIQELIERGWVYETDNDGRRRILLTPWDLALQALPRLWDIPWKQLTKPAPSREIAPAPLWSPFIHDIFQFASFTRQEPLLLTNQQEVYRRQKNKLEKLLWPRSYLNPTGTVDYLLAVMAQFGFFIVLDGPYRFETSDKIADVMQMDPQDLFHFFARYFFDPARLQWPALVWAALASRLPADAALHIGTTVEWMRSIGLTTANTQYLFNYAVNDLSVWELWDACGKDAARLTDWGYAALRGLFEQPEATSTLIQPTGEILVPPNAPLDERWAIDGVATRVKSDRVSTYRLDQTSAKRGVQQSLTVETHISIIEALTRNPMPENVRINLHDWYRVIGRHRIMEVTLIHSPVAEDSRELETWLGKDALERLSPSDIIIPHNRVKDILKRLERAGAPILPEVLTPSQDPPPFHESPRYTTMDQQWAVRLATEAPATTPAPKDLRRLLNQALQENFPAQVTYEVPGHTLPQSHAVVPISMDNQWVQVYDVDEQRYLLIGWQQILAVELI